MATEGVRIDSIKVAGLASLPGVQAELHRVGELGADKARGIAPVDTGELRDAIDVLDRTGYVLVGSFCDHAIYPEMGTRKMRARPYLRPSFAGPLT